MGCGNNFTTDISEQLNIGHVKEVYASTNKANYIPQMLKHNNQCTNLHDIEETLLYVALQDWYSIDSAIVFHRLLAASNNEIQMQPIFYASSIVTKSYLSSPYQNRYIVWEKLMSAQCVEVSP